MQALICKDFGLPESLILKDIPEQIPAENEVQITVKACGVNFPDTLIIQNQYQFKPELPFSPGGEVAGVVSAVGSAVDKFKIGDSVFSLCKWGGFSEKLVVDKSQVFALPDGLSFTSGASLFYNYGTAYHALADRGKLKPKETLLVLGAAGGVGLAAVELGKVMGAKVIAAASSSEKLRVCQEKGADFLINYQSEHVKDKIKELTNGKGVDVIFDPVGGDLTESALRGIAWKGRYLMAGFASGSIPNIPQNLTLLKGCSLVGVFYGRFSKEEPQKAEHNFEMISKYHAEGRISPYIYGHYSLAEAPKALEDMMNRKVIGKALVLPVSLDEASQISFGRAIKPSRLSFKSKEEIYAHAGKEMGKSQWMKITQERIRQFAESTEDYQWIHLDEEKAKESVFGSTIAHGYLTLSLIPKMLNEIYEVPFSKMGVNFGADKIRFLHPVPSGSEIRLSAKLKQVSEGFKGSLRIIIEATIEIKNIEKPACYAELISLNY